VIFFTTCTAYCIGGIYATTLSLSKIPAKLPKAQSQ
jgi:hypothetical protein